MTSLLEFLDTVYRFGLPVLVVPIAVWTLLHLPVRMLLQSRLFAHTDARYLGHVAWLSSLPISVVVAATIHATGFQPPQLELPLIELTQGSLSVSTADTTTAATISARHVVGGLMLLFGVAILIRSAAFLSRWRSARSFHIGSLATPAWLNEIADEWKVRLRIRRRTRVIVAEGEAVPMTIGIRQPVVVIPQSLLDDRSSLALALTHELIHVARFDDAVHAFECLCSALFGWHPAVRRLCNDLPACREVACDSAVLAFHANRARPYADLLLRFASRPVALTTNVVSMSDSPNTIKKRIEAMTKREIASPQLRLTGFVLGALLFGIAGFVVACTDVVKPTAEAAPEADQLRIPPPPPPTADGVHFVVEQMPKLIGGLEGALAKLQYPAIATKAGVEGRVTIQFVVDKDGNVRDAEVLRGIGAGCDEEALRVVQTLKFEPGMQRGEPVPVAMSLPIMFRL